MTPFSFLVAVCTMGMKAIELDPKRLTVMGSTGSLKYLEVAHSGALCDSSAQFTVHRMRWTTWSGLGSYPSMSGQAQRSPGGNTAGFCNLLLSISTVLKVHDRSRV